MTATTSATTVDRTSEERHVPPMGGFSPTLLRIELRRLLRNRRAVVFTIVMPVVFFLIFGVGQKYSNHSAGHGNVAAYVMISMAIYGAMLATTSGGAMVSIERSLGWSRQLRLTPLSPVAYVATKLVTAMTMGLVSVVVTAVVVAAAGAGLLRVLERRTPEARRVWTGVAMAALVVSLLGPASARTVQAALTLAALHLVVGAVVIVGLRRRHADRPTKRATNPATNRVA